jgi:hypothetical protein
MKTKIASLLIVGGFLSTTACSSYFDEQNRQYYDNLHKQAEERNVKACEKNISKHSSWSWKDARRGQSLLRKAKWL